MSVRRVDKQLIDYLCRQTGMHELEASRLIQEIHAFYNETPHDFIRRRHYELQKAGLNNERIYTLINDELQFHRFCSEPMSTRQIRRAIYG